MNRSHTHCALVSLIGLVLWSGLAPPGAAQPGMTASKTPLQTEAQPVRVLVLTPMQDKAKRSYGLRVLAGICLALSEPPDDLDFRKHADPPDIFIDAELQPILRTKETLQRSSKSPHHAGRRSPSQTCPPGLPPNLCQIWQRSRPQWPEELWKTLAAFSDPTNPRGYDLLVTVRWPSKEGPYSIQFKFRDEKRFNDDHAGRELHRMADADIIFGPVTSDEARNLLRDAGEEEEVPILTASATATFLTWSYNETTREYVPLDSVHPSFYRFTSPDRDLAGRLALELVQGVRARRIALLYEDTSYGNGLREDFVRALNEYGFQEWDRVPAIHYTPGIAGGLDAHAEPHVDCPICQPESNRTPAVVKASLPSAGDEVKFVESFLRQLSAWRPDALGIFGTLEDKLALLPKRCYHLPRTLMFTTDADLGLEDFHCGETEYGASTIIASLLHPGREKDGELLLHAASLLASHPTVQPDVYMLQARHGTRFLLTMVQRLREIQRRYPAYRAADVFRMHRMGNLDPGELQSVPIMFEANGDLQPADRALGVLGAQQAPPQFHSSTASLALPRIVPREGVVQLLALKDRKLVAVDHPSMAIELGPFSTAPPEALYGVLFVLLVIVVVGGSHLGLWENDEPARVCAQTAVKESARRNPAVVAFSSVFRDGEWPAWFPYCCWAFVCFGLFLVLAEWNGDENVSFLPNEYSVLPTVFLQCQVAAICLWLPSHMRFQLRRVREQMERSGARELVEKIDELAKDLFGISRRAWLLLPPLVLLLLGLDLWVGVPISGWHHDRTVFYTSPFFGYAVIAFVTGCAYLFALRFVWKMREFERQLAEDYPAGENLWITYHNFRLLVAPLADLTYLAALLFAGYVISRTSFFDHWAWSFFHYLFFALIAGMLLWLLFDAHRQWHLRMCMEKRGLLDRLLRGAVPQDQQQKMLDQVQTVPNWPWNPTVALRVVIALLAPFVVSLLQHTAWALDLWRSIGRLLGSG